MRKKLVTAFFVAMSVSSITFASASDINSVKQEIKSIEESKNADYDVQKAVAALYEKLTQLEAKYKEDSDKDSKITELNQKIENLKKKQAEDIKQKQEIKDYLKNLKENPPQDETPKVEKIKYDAPRQATTDYVLNVPNSSKANNYIQDGINAQGYARMVFAYGPEQVYKIYCKIGYLTDIKFADGESITYVGGGDTAQWMIDHASVNNTSHLYVKPIANNIATNVIVNTDKGHIYQILLSSGSWFNPMVSWSYGNEDIVKSELKKQEETSYIAKSGVNPENISFSYKIKADKNVDFKPTAVFNDGRRTYIKFKDVKTLPVLFVKDKDDKLILANYKSTDNTFTVDTVFDEAVLKLDEKEVVIIRKD